MHLRKRTTCRTPHTFTHTATHTHPSRTPSAPHSTPPSPPLSPATMKFTGSSLLLTGATLLSTAVSSGRHFGTQAWASPMSTLAHVLFPFPIVHCRRRGRCVDGDGIYRQTSGGGRDTRCQRRLVQVGDVSRGLVAGGGGGLVLRVDPDIVIGPLQNALRRRGSKEGVDVSCQTRGPGREVQHNAERRGRGNGRGRLNGNGPLAPMGPVRQSKGYSGESRMVTPGSAPLLFLQRTTTVTASAVPSRRR